MTVDRSVTSRESSPIWLRRIIEAIGEGMDSTESWEWQHQIDTALRNSVGVHPLTAVHDWYAHSLGPLFIEASMRWARPPRAQEAVRALHLRAAAGVPIAETTWARALEPALRQIYRQAYPYARAYGAAAADATAYATAHGYTTTEASRFGDSYAEMNTEANARVHAEANAAANAAALASAFASGDASAYAATYPVARVRAGVLACAGYDAARLPLIWRRVGAGLCESLARAGVNSPSADHR